MGLEMTTEMDTYFSLRELSVDTIGEEVSITQPSDKLRLELFAFTNGSRINLYFLCKQQEST
jgi:hypothetical protein